MNNVPTEPVGKRPYSPPPVGMHPMPNYPRTNSMATASFVLGLCGFLTCGFTSVFGIIFGHIANKQIKQAPAENKSMATAGLVLGYLITSAWLIWWMVAGVAMVASLMGLTPTTNDLYGNYPADLPSFEPSYALCLETSAPEDPCE